MSILDEELEILEREAQKAAVLNLAHPKQRAVLLSGSRRKAIRCTRRAGKSFVMGLDIVLKSIDNPGASLIYVAPTREMARKIMIKDVLEPICQKLAIEYEFNKATLDFKLENGCVCYLLGTDKDEAQADKALGQKYIAAYVDEAAFFETNLEYLLFSVLEPALADYAGSLTLASTANRRNPFSVFYDITERDDLDDKKRRGWEVFRWGWKDNPFTAIQVAELIDNLTKQDPNYLNSRDFRQSWLDEWILDNDALVYRFSESRNLATSLPKKDKWIYTVACDLGYNDDTAITVSAWSPDSDTLFFVECYKKSGMDFTAVGAKLREMRARYNPARMVIDASNKQGVEELRERQGLWMLEPAIKAGKLDAIELFNADMESGKIKFLPQARGIYEEYAKLVWNSRLLEKGKREESATRANHGADSALYNYRATRSHLGREKTATTISNEERIELEMLKAIRNEGKNEDAEFEGW